MKTTCLCFVVIVLLSPEAANVVAERSGQTEVSNEETTTLPTEDGIWSIHSKSFTRHTLADGTAATTEASTSESKIRRGKDKSSRANPSPSKCDGSNPVKLSAKSNTESLAVRKNTEDDEACCEECRRFSESSMLCRSYFRAEDSTGRCYLYESP
eukprot:g3747.t1